MSQNPFLTSFSHPYGIPPFDLIQLEDFENGISAAILQQKEEIAQIVTNSAEISFENTILALERSGSILRRTTAVMYNLLYAHGDESLQQMVQKLTPALSAHNDSIYMDATLFARVDHIWRHIDDYSVDDEDKKLVETYYKVFVSNGALLSEAQKERVSEINARLALLSLQFSENLMASINRYELIIIDAEKLAGMPKQLIDAAYEIAQQKGINNTWIFTLQNASVMPFLSNCRDRELRREIWEAMIQKGNQNDDLDNKAIIKETIALRGERAKILGYDNHASYVLKDRMAKNTSQVNQLLQDLWKRTQAPVQKETLRLQAELRADGYMDILQAYDWRYYAELVRKRDYDLDEEVLRPYFELNKVVQGMRDVAQQLYGITCIEIEAPTYHPEVKTYLVQESNGTDVGVLMMDYHPRATKQGGAWMTSYRDQHKIDGQRVLPIISIVCNFTPPTSGGPSLLTFDEVNTLYHEFGHALHGLLSNVQYASLAGTNVPTDFVELPSQIMENWASHRTVMASYARHVDTGAVIPETILDKLDASAKYGQGFALTEYLAASILDMAYHTHKGKIDDVEVFEQQTMEAIGLTSAILPRYRSTYFSHIFGGGYAAGYYSYIWSEVLDADAFALFEERGIFDTETAQRFRQCVLSRGGTIEPDELYKLFRGREADVDALLRKRGIA
jgi:peptidyl-dipeptidase Dcp